MESESGKSGVRVTRRSVCGGDSVGAPHEEFLEYGEDELLSEWFVRLRDYLPMVRDEVGWEIQGDTGVLGYFVGNADGTLDAELAVDDGLMADAGIEEVFCEYFCHKSDMRR